MINAVIIDDEINNIQNLSMLLEKYCPEVNIIATALNTFEGERIINENKPDLVFLDIQMPERSGFDLIRSLPANDFEIIFVTAFDKYGIQAVKFSAIDYLLKPVDIKELKAAVDKVSAKRQKINENYKLKNLINLLQKEKDKDAHRIALPLSGEIRFVKTGDIIHCESSNNYTTFYLTNKEKILISKPIYEFENLLDDYGFIRCHQSHLVNRKFVKSWLKKDGDYLLLEDNSQIPISRQKKDYIKEQLTKRQ